MLKLDLEKYQAFFFDFDGVIAASVHIKTVAFGELFKEYGKDIQEKVVEYHRKNGGISRYEKFKYYYRNFFNKEITPEIIAELDRKYSQLVLDKVVKAPYIPGALDFLSALKQNKKLTFVISGTPQKEIRQVVDLKKINELFDEAAGSPTDKKENLKRLLEKYAINNKQAIFFGDARADYEAAKENQVRFIGVGREEELQGIGEFERIDDFHEVTT